MFILCLHFKYENRAQINIKCWYTSIRRSTGDSVRRHKFLEDTLIERIMSVSIYDAHLLHFIELYIQIAIWISAECTFARS